MTYKIYTLGCKVNEYESEIMKELLENHGFTYSEKPDVVIVNTCTVTNKADSKSRKILRSIRRNNKNALIIAVGCLIQNSKEDLTNIEYDIAVGNQDKTKIIDYIEKYSKKTEYLKDMNKASFENMNLNNFDRTRAYIKIQDGCDNYCAFCIIPFVRGHVRCKKKEDVLEEAKRLISNNHKEIVLTGIHTGNYHDGDYNFSDLVEDLIKLDLFRLRISSIEITELDEKFLSLLKNDKLASHMHIPLQSGSDTILKSMNRKYDTNYFINIINKLRNVRPNINITTDIIVGFPGETEENFNETINTIKKVGFSKIHVFPYSDRDGTKASKMDNHVNEFIKKKRVKTLLDLSKNLEIKYMENNLGENSFIPEIYKDGFLIGHTSNFLKVKVPCDKNLSRQIVNVYLEKVEYPYVIGKII